MGGSDVVWLTLRGLRLGLSYAETMDLPLSVLLDLVNAQAILDGTRRVKTSEPDEEAAFWALLERM